MKDAYYKINLGGIRDPSRVFRSKKECLEWLFDNGIVSEFNCCPECFQSFFSKESYSGHRSAKRIPIDFRVCSRCLKENPFTVLAAEDTFEIDGDGVIKKEIPFGNVCLLSRNGSSRNESHGGTHCLRFVWKNECQGYPQTPGTLSVEVLERLKDDGQIACMEFAVDVNDKILCPYYLEHCVMSEKDGRILKTMNPKNTAAE